MGQTSSKSPPIENSSSTSSEPLVRRFLASEILPFDRQHLENSPVGRGASAVFYKVKIASRFDKSSDEEAKSEDQEDQEGALKQFNGNFGPLSHDLYSREPLFQKIKQEACLLTRFKHENILQFMGYCIDEPSFGLVFELCNGGTLRKLLSSIEDSVPVETMVLWASQIASGMRHLADMGYVHKKLKAENILIKQAICLCNPDTDQCPKCGGSGLNKLQLKITGLGSAVASQLSTPGTYAWLAPESFKTNTFSEASDVWSFGVVLWEIVTRKMPFTGFFPLAFAFAVVRDGLFLDVDESCPKEWEDIMKKCWEFEPVNRPKFEKIEADLLLYLITLLESEL